LERRVWEYKPHPKNIEKLMVILEEEWNKIELEINKFSQKFAKKGLSCIR
jgi:hypothetical protein